jgi:hypothetical protein
VASPPRGVPPQLLPELRQLIRDVFTHGYIAAIRPTLAISVAVLLAGAAGCLLLRRHTPAPVASRPAEVISPAGEMASPAGEVTSPAGGEITPTAAMASPAAASARPASAAIPAGPGSATSPAAAPSPHPAEARAGGASSS